LAGGGTVRACEACRAIFKPRRKTSRFCSLSCIRFQDLTGQVFGRLTAIQRAANADSGKTRWDARCVCGAETVVFGEALKSGNTQSCGCLAQESLSARVTHGRTETTEYVAWRSMLSRCLNPKVEEYPNYGGRGIQVCDRWASFEAFFADMGERPTDGHSLDRKDVNGNYEPGNCRWATSREQAENTRANRVLDHDGESLCLSAWARRTGIAERTIATRLDLGWSVAEALTTPVRPMRRRAA
jgi:hypothetical protein